MRLSAYLALPASAERPAVPSSSPTARSSRLMAGALLWQPSRTDSEASDFHRVTRFSDRSLFPVQKATRTLTKSALSRQKRSQRSAMAAAGAAPRRKQRTAGATPARRRSGQQRSVLESLLAGDAGDAVEADEGGRGGATPAGKRSGGSLPLSEARRSAKKRRKKLRRARKRQRLREEREREQGPEREPEPELQADDNQAEHDAESGADSDANDENAPPNDCSQGSPVIRKRLFPGSDSSTSSESDKPDESADEQADEPEQEQKNYRQFVSKYAAASSSVLEAVTPRDQKKARRRMQDTPSPEEVGNTSILSESRLSDWQFKDTDDEDAAELEVELAEDDDWNDPTYDPHRSLEHVTVRKKKSRVKTVSSEEKLKSAHKEAYGSEPVQTSDQRRRRTRSTVLARWGVEWPLKLAPSGKDVQLVVLGIVQGHPARYEIAKRITSTHFSSTAREPIILDGSFDANLSGGDDIPDRFVELMASGIPPRYKRLLAPFAPDFSESSQSRYALTTWASIYILGLRIVFFV